MRHSQDAAVAAATVADDARSAMLADLPVRVAGALLDRAQSRGICAAFVAGDEVYGGRELRRSIRQRDGLCAGRPRQPRCYCQPRAAP